MFPRMVFSRGGGSLLSRQLHRNTSYPVFQQCVVFSSDTSEQRSKAVSLLERERRRRANITTSVITRLQTNIQKHGLHNIWPKMDEEKGSVIETDDRILPRLSKYWREQVMNMLSYSTENIVPQVSNFELGQSLYQHCLENFDTFDRFQKLSICANYIAHCVIYAPSSIKEKLILDAYENIMEQAVVMDRHFAEIVIRGLSHTREWRKCSEIIEKSTGIFDLNISHFSPYIRAAIEDGEIDFAFELVHRLDTECLIPNDEIFTAFISTDNEDILEKFLNICHQKKWVPTKDSACKLMDWFESNHSKHWVGSFALTERERCQHCARTLELAEDMTVEEFTALRDAMVKNTFEGDQGFVHSTPEEARSFQEFLRKNQGWDIVVDGLNLGFSFLAVDRTLNKRTMALQVQEVINDLHHRLGKRVCIIAKSHMQQWNLSVFREVETIADIFYTRNDSDDDRFLLIAALSSSPDTMILSRDFFRQHSHPLPDRRQREQIIRWQRTHQVGIKTERNGEFYYKMPPKHDFCIQTTGSSWHIPYLDSGTIIYSTGVNNSSASNRRQGKASYEAPNHWICLQHKKADRMRARDS